MQGTHLWDRAISGPNWDLCRVLLVFSSPQTVVPHFRLTHTRGPSSDMCDDPGWQSSGESSTSWTLRCGYSDLEFRLWKYWPVTLHLGLDWHCLLVQISFSVKTLSVQEPSSRPLSLARCLLSWISRQSLARVQFTHGSGRQGFPWLCLNRDTSKR